VTPYERGADAYRRGKPDTIPLDIERDEDAEAWAEGYWSEYRRAHESAYEDMEAHHMVDRCERLESAERWKR